MMGRLVAKDSFQWYCTTRRRTTRVLQLTLDSIVHDLDKLRALEKLFQALCRDRELFGGMSEESVQRARQAVERRAEELLGGAQPTILLVNRLGGCQLFLTTQVPVDDDDFRFMMRSNADPLAFFRQDDDEPKCTTTTTTTRLCTAAFLPSTASTVASIIRWYLYRAIVSLSLRNGDSRCKWPFPNRKPHTGHSP